MTGTLASIMICLLVDLIPMSLVEEVVARLVEVGGRWFGVQGGEGVQGREGCTVRCRAVQGGAVRCSELQWCAGRCSEVQ